MKCVLDNIIFSLQRSGGASVVWQEHIERLIQEHDIDLKFIEYDNALKNNIFRSLLDIPSSFVDQRSNNLLCLKRYFDLNTNIGYKHIFHSSHYRIDNNENAINVTTVHDFTYDLYQKGLRKYVHCHQKYNAIRKADAIICISESTKKDLLKYLPDVDAGKIHVIYNGVNSCFKIIDNKDYSLSLPYEDKGFVLYVGSRRPLYKNFPIVVKVCSMMKIPLIIVGGEEINAAEKSFLDSQFPKVYYTHYKGLSTIGLNELYNRALVLLYPSLYEGFGIPIIEAQKAGCPVIAYASSSIPEVIGDSEMLLKETSLSVLKDSINLISNASVRKSEIDKGLVNSSRFSWDNTFDRTIELYRKVYK